VVDKVGRKTSLESKTSVSVQVRRGRFSAWLGQLASLDILAVAHIHIFRDPRHACAKLAAFFLFISFLR
jgi:hypothetical protein